MANLTAEIVDQDVNDLESLRAGLEELNGPDGEFHSVDGNWRNIMRCNSGVDMVIESVKAIRDHSIDATDIEWQSELEDIRAYLQLARLYKKQPEILKSIAHSEDFFDAIISGEITDDEFVDFYPKHYLERMGGDWYYDMLAPKTAQVFEFAGVDPWPYLVDMADGGREEIIADPDHFDSLVRNFELNRAQQFHLVDIALASSYERLAKCNRKTPGHDSTSILYGGDEASAVRSIYNERIAKLQTVRDRI